MGAGVAKRGGTRQPCGGGRDARGRPPGPVPAPGVDSTGAPRTVRPDVIGDIVLLLVLLVPIALWAVVRWLPQQRRRQTREAPAVGPQKRWWQP